jgi:Domain of unknown function (DUF6456)
MIGFAGWLRRMSTPGAVLKPINGDAGTYGVFPKGDLRRRPLARLSAASLAKARAEGVLREISPDCYQLAVRPDVVAQRRAGDYRSPHQLIFEQPVVDGDGNTTTLRVNIADSPLARWMKPDVTTGRSWLSETEFEAGERLRADYHRSVLSERVTANWEGYLAPTVGRSSRGAGDAPLSAIAAKESVYSALDFVGPGLDRILSAVCLRENGIETVEQAESWPRRSGKTILKVGLQRLAIYYGLISPPTVRL